MCGVALSAVCDNCICELIFLADVFGATSSWQIAISTLVVLIMPIRRERHSIAAISVTL